MELGDLTVSLRDCGQLRSGCGMETDTRKGRPFRGRLTRTVPALIIAILVIGLSPTASVALRAEPMGQHHAGEYYLKGACAGDKAVKRFSWRVWLGRDTIRMTEVQRRLPEIKRYTRDYAESVEAWVEHLRKPPAGVAQGGTHAEQAARVSQWTIRKPFAAGCTGQFGERIGQMVASLKGL